MKGLIVKTQIAGECEALEVALPEGSVDVSLELNRYAQMMGNPAIRTDRASGSHR